MPDGFDFIDGKAYVGQQVASVSIGNNMVALKFINGSTLIIRPIRGHGTGPELSVRGHVPIEFDFIEGMVVDTTEE